MEMVEVVMNPVRQRIFQYLLIHEKGTVKEIKKELQDIPSASLYRHVKILRIILLLQLWKKTGSGELSKVSIRLIKKRLNQEIRMALLFRWAC